jgi:hypothetical protein
VNKVALRVEALASEGHPDKELIIDHSEDVVTVPDLRGEIVDILMVLEFHEDGGDWIAWRVPPAGPTTDMHNAVLERLHSCFGQDDAEILQKMGALYVRQFTNRGDWVLNRIGCELKV